MIHEHCLSVILTFKINIISTIPVINFLKKSNNLFIKHSIFHVRSRVAKISFVLLAISSKIIPARVIFVFTLYQEYMSIIKKKEKKRKERNRSTKIKERKYIHVIYNYKTKSHSISYFWGSMHVYKNTIYITNLKNHTRL